MTSLSKASLHALVATAAVVLATPAVAQTPTYIVRGSTGTQGCTQNPPFAWFDITSSAPVVGKGGCDFGFAVAEGTARAGTGSLGTFSKGSASNRDSLRLGWSSSAYAEDFVRFTSSNPSATQASVSLLLNLEGILLSNGGFDVADVDGSVVLNGIRSTFLFNPSANTVSISGFNVLSGPFVIDYGIPISLLLQTNPVIVPLNQPVSLVLTLGSGIVVGGPTSFASSSFLNSFEVPLGRDAFALPDGVTANSGTWLVNNRRIDPNAGAIPEPASWAMMIMGFGLSGVVMRWRTRKAVAA